MAAGHTQSEAKLMASATATGYERRHSAPATGIFSPSAGEGNRQTRMGKNSVLDPPTFYIL
ncbi:hypothetical protein MNKW57_19980 [Biformimicrobium ophioploci]|uniref:Uncharacterized protein n=1 Tax=Biformimicrobium ophioploci TaxID=3036711 RepID=A0ABQ6M022_9GAMM|nr:hypothetical protein MNKW57_19980 [Microbulbifer sp. NKW57]